MVLCYGVTLAERPWELEPIPPPRSIPRVLTYTIHTNQQLQSQTTVIQKTVAGIYAAPQGWQRAGIRFAYTTTSHPTFTIDFTTGSQIAAASTICDSFYNCTVGDTIYVNTTRWLHGDGWPGTFANYHALLINHETGHILGLDEWGCICALSAAPVMLYHQNTTGLHLWRPNPWPITAEIHAVKKSVV